MRLKSGEKRLVCEMTNSMVLPRNIQTTLKNINDRSATTIKLLYNARHMY